MKYLIILLLQLSICAFADAQTRTTSGSSTRKVVNSPAKTHLAFDGLSINGHQMDFYNKLKKKGYKFHLIEGDETEPFYYATGKYAGIEGWEVYADIWDEEIDSVYAVTLYREYANGMNHLYGYEDAKKYIESNYAVTSQEKLRGELSFGDDTETIYHIGNKGRITVVSDIKDDGTLYLRIRFIDNENEKLYGYQPDIRKYELNSNLKSYQNCIIEISEEEIKFKAKTANKSYTFVSRGDDKELIEELINGNFDSQTKKDVLNNYILTGIEECKDIPDIPILKEDFESICRQYAATKKAAQQRQQTFSLSDILLEWVFQKSVPKEASDEFKEKMRKEVFEPVRESMHRSRGSSSDYNATTNWDMLNDAQKAVIHDHDNGR